MRRSRELRRVCRPGGVVAARDGDYRAMTWYPRPTRGWTAGWRSTAPWPGPTAASRTPAVTCVALGAAAGFGRHGHGVGAGASPTATDRAWWGGRGPTASRLDAFARQAVERLATTADLDRDRRRLARLGRAPPTAGSPSSTARSSPPPSPTSPAPRGNPRVKAPRFAGTSPAGRSAGGGTVDGVSTWEHLLVEDVEPITRGITPTGPAAQRGRRPS